MIDLTGKRFGRLRVVRRAGSRNTNVTWLCVCDCGAERVVMSMSLRAGDTKSCGCLFRELSSKRMRERLREKSQRRYRLDRAQREDDAASSADGVKRWRGADAASLDLARALGIL